MITCKICEKEVIEDLLGPHSQKCREVFESKEELRNIMSSMETHGDKASSMRNSLETYATKQQKKYNKRTSSRDLLDVSITGHLKSQNSGLAGMSPAVSRRLNESGFSEDGRCNILSWTENQLEKTSDRTISTQETVETQDDIGKKMSEEEHLKVLEEVKKSIIVLKKVIDYAKNIADWALDLTSVCEVGIHTQAELEAYEKEIIDTNVLQFLQAFNFDVHAYIILREKYVTASNELMKIGSPKNIGIKAKPAMMKKSQSFKNKQEGLVKGAIFGLKLKTEDPGSAITKKKESPGLEKRKLGTGITPIQIGTGSPGLEKRKLPGGVSPIEVGTASPSLERRKLSHGTLQAEAGLASPSLEKRKMSIAGSIEVGLGGSLSKKGTTRPLPQTSETGKPNILQMFASPSMKGMKADLSKNLLTVNNNHMSGLFTTPRKTGEENLLDPTKTLLQTNVNHMASFSGFQTPKRNPEDNSSLRDKIKASVNLNFLDKSPRSSDLGTMSPMSSSRKTVGKINLNANATLSAFGKAKTEVKTANDQAKPVNKKPTTPVSGTGGMGWFKSIRNEDTAGLSKFASPVPTRSTNPNSEDEATPTAKKSNGMTFLEGSAVNFQKPKPKNETAKEFFESPMMKGYYSDCNASRSKRRISRLDSNDVSLEDFEFIKYVGKGAYGTVWLVKKKATGAHYAMKMVEWADRGTQNRMKALKAEKDIYATLEGDFVVKALWTFHYENSICFVTEYMLGGDFCKILDRVSRLDEPEAQFYFAELVLAVESLHKLGVVHRDLKPDNILMDEKGHIRLTDFGLSQKGIDRLKGNTTPNRKASMSPNSHEDALVKARVNMLNKMCKNSPSSSKRIEFKQKTLNLKGSRTMFGFLGKEEEYHRMIEKKPIVNKAHTGSPGQGAQAEKKQRMVGTPDYMAPEIISSDKYDMEGYDDKNMDWWSMGVILYQLLVGIPPFCDNTVEAVFENIREHRIEFPPVGDDEGCISSQAYSLINQLLNPDFKKRLGAKGGAEEVKKHPFFEGIDWTTLREREAPIIPCSLEEQLANPEDEPKTPATVKMNSDLANANANADSPAEGFAIMRSKTAKPMQFNGFQMRRLDLLDKANQDTHKELVRQKSGKLQLS